ncbi:helix-turn-helix transcriptional regulator [Kallotenue papyrolyticum]|uniref:helix-turn-helix transcriptional regulator n=1 Tax=Kallotenue papyrolyticum TaxID=1325125 RepID=UPI000478609B|nr:WYL domain-containing protein [Kallotenue papyrolyticum]
MITHRGGTKRSSWLAFKRCLVLVRALLREPQPRDELIALVRAELGEEAYTEAATSALKHDLDALKREYGCQIVFERSTGRYHLRDLGELALLDLSDACLDGLAFLQESFPEGSALPEHANIPPLLQRILSLLPSHRRQQYQAMRGVLRLQLPGKAMHHISERVVVQVRRAIQERRQIEFRYRDTDGKVRLHRVAPYHVFFRPEGHAYLDATVLEAHGTSKPAPNTAVEYRLDRIVPNSVTILNQVLPPQRPPIPTYRLRYRLVPDIARRRDVATYFPETHIVYHNDGSATITATVTNLWQARQTLLRYGDGCVVEEPPELIDMFRQTVRGLQRIYGE